VERVRDHMLMTMTLKVRVNAPTGPVTVVLKSVQKHDSQLAPM
jgi:hypothetical protein